MGFSIFFLVVAAASIGFFAQESTAGVYEVVGVYWWNEDCDYPSNNIEWFKLDKNQLSTTKQPCGEACLANKDCAYWVHNPKSSMCYLKLAPTQSAVTSSGKICGNVPSRIRNRMFKVSKDGTHEFSKTCSFEGAEFEAVEELEIQGKARSAACGKACKAHPKCSHFTFNKPTGKCFLKKTGTFVEAMTSTESVCGYIPKRRQHKEELLTAQVAAPK